jgi:hydroxymethylbilane synthase
VTERFRVGSRRSPLARRQTQGVLDRLGGSPSAHRFEMVFLDTSGDRDRSLGGSPDFTDALDRALVDGEIDLAVHSAKDLPVELDPRLDLAACPRRANPRDCLVVGAAFRRGPLPRGATVGSSSPRRRAQLHRWRPDLAVVEVRGNVDTRIGLVRSGRIDAAILAVAGISRLGRSEEIARVLPSTDFLPAPGQGALAVVTRAGDRTVAEAARRVDHPATRACVTAERRFALALGGDCRAPLGALAQVHDGALALVGEVLAPNGRLRLRGGRRGSSDRAAALGALLGRDLLDRGARALWTPARP